MNMEDSYPSDMFMDKTAFILGGVDRVSNSGMGGMSTSEDKDGAAFHYDTKLILLSEV
tara:strand:- start:232 stop:405 length:174 start_codon:yes stop_codon:yes gene_type:complete